MKPLRSRRRVGAWARRRIGDTDRMRPNVVVSDAPMPRRPDAIVLGIDPGLATTGWGVIVQQGTTPELKAFGVILSPASDALPDRLKCIRQELADLIALYRPTVLAIEQLFFAKFAISIAATAQARGVILVTAAEANLPIAEYNPRAVKLALTGFGSASKTQIQSMVQKQFRLQELPRPDDAADALAIALCHLQTNPQLSTSGRRLSAAVESV